MEHICDKSMCAGCMACVSVCPRNAIRINEGFEFYEPIIDQELCIDCGRCISICQQKHPSRFRKPIEWKQGWAKNLEERLESSSGGLAYAIAKSFIANDGIVVACTFAQGKFGFEACEDINTLLRFRGSKYVKSNPKDAYRLVIDALKNGRRVLYIGLPCQVSSMINFVGEKHSANLYTIDLICHGTPAPAVLNTYLSNRGLEINSFERIDFRRKTTFAIREGEKTVDTIGVRDRYLIAFLAGLSYTENCYYCLYARSDRVSDLTLGDSWGTELVDEEVNGISLVLCMTEKGRELLSASSIVLNDVDLANAIRTNAQLKCPSQKPHSRNRFISNYRAGMSFEKNVSLCLPKECFRQDVKRFLVQIGLR